MNFFYSISVNDRYRFPIILNDWRKEDKDLILEGYNEDDLLQEYEKDKGEGHKFAVMGDGDSDSFF